MSSSRDERCSTQSPLKNGFVNEIVQISGEQSVDESGETEITLIISDIDSQNWHENSLLVDNNENYGITSNQTLPENQVENNAPTKSSKSMLPDKEYFKSIFCTGNRMKNVVIDCTSPINNREKVSVCSRASLESLDKRGRDLDKAFSAGNVIDKSARGVNNLSTFLELHRLKQTRIVQRSNNNDGRNFDMSNETITQVNLETTNQTGMEICIDGKLKIENHCGSYKERGETQKRIDCHSQLIEFENHEVLNNDVKESQFSHVKYEEIMDSTTSNLVNNSSPSSPILNTQGNRFSKFRKIDSTRVKKTLFDEKSNLSPKKDSDEEFKDNEDFIISPKLSVDMSPILSVMNSTFNSRNKGPSSGAGLSPILNTQGNRFSKFKKSDRTRVKKTLFDEKNSLPKIDNDSVKNNEESLIPPEISIDRCPTIYNSQSCVPLSPILGTKRSLLSKTSNIYNKRRKKSPFDKHINSLSNKDSDEYTVNPISLKRPVPAVRSQCSEEVEKLRSPRIKKMERNWTLFGNKESSFGTPSQESMTIDKMSVMETSDNSLHIEAISSQVDNLEPSHKRKEIGLPVIEPVLSQTEASEAHAASEQSQYTPVKDNKAFINPPSSDEGISSFRIKTRKRKYNENSLVSRSRSILNRCKSQHRMWEYEMRLILQSTDSSDLPVFTVKKFSTRNYIKCYRDSAIDPDYENFPGVFSLAKSFNILCDNEISNKKEPGERFKVHPPLMVLEHQNEIYLAGGTRLELVGKSESSIIGESLSHSSQNIISTKEVLDQSTATSDGNVSSDENKKDDFNSQVFPVRCLRDIIVSEGVESPDDWNKNNIEKCIVKIKEFGDFDNPKGLIRLCRLFRFFVADFFLIGTVVGWGKIPEKRHLGSVKLQGKYYALLCDSDKDVCALVFSTEDDLCKLKGQCQTGDLAVLAGKKYRVAGFVFTHRMPVKRCSWLSAALPNELSELEFINFLSPKSPEDWSWEVID